MGKRTRSKQQRGPKKTAELRCTISSDQDLAKECANALKRALGLNQVLHKKRQRSKVTSLYFFSSPKVEAEIRGESLPVLPITGSTRWFHIAIDLLLIDARTWEVKHVSIGLLQGDPSAMLKPQILRAEWQAHEDYDGSGHAQPHWHVLNTSHADESVLPTFKEFIESSGFNKFLANSESPAAEEKFEHFHYAMVTNWHNAAAASPCQSLSNEASLISWLEGCVRYIIHQLSHVDKKSGR